MPLDATRNALVLPMLGLLVEQPAHAYDVAARLAGRYPLLAGTRSSVTTLLKSLAGADLVRARDPERAGRRPARTVYELTAAGLELFRNRVGEGLGEGPPASAAFLTALAYLGILPRATAAAVLAERVERLSRELTRLPPDPPELAEIQMIEVAYWRTVLHNEITWLSTLVPRVESGDLAWPGQARQ
ncbi:PadR family transcriptional regulator [Paractinoplanes ferrugineus]|uniref:PadR family transcriptional regulator n=1 Tax=Paractinoplanes ferrugineus TaxID=113564 RepID=A0A919J8K4_9ACTN|nr:helix-turn-helix transcriptional regulator [Actinoplanes ferrugineus]GIE15539.1 PadR family transcriptional regulator [Actinoplanes ferrugineus]